MNATKSSSYSVEDFLDPEAEIARLRTQAGLIAALEDAALEALGLPEQGRILDVGCGPGFVAARLLSRHPTLEITGIDSDPGMVQRALRHIEAVSGDARALPFPDAHFCGAYARLVLRHVPHADRVLREMARVVRPGGRVIVIDSDDAALVVEPMPDAFEVVLSARQETARRRGGDPFIGRRLPGLLRATDLQNIAVHLLAFDSVSIGARTFAAVVLAPIGEGSDADLLSSDIARSVSKSLDAWSEHPGAFGMTTAIAVAGTKRR
jgi:SAM-dependent methyltransferase